MLNLLYNIFIFPIVQIIEITFVIIDRIFFNKVLSIVGVSAVISVCTMPLYFIAEKWQISERELFKKLKPKIDKIKSVFKGDEQYMILSAYYRQNHYHPVYALRNSFSTLIQIPFFIAAYSYLSHLDYIKNVSFLFINDLGSPDKLFSLSSLNINILPIVMLLINCISGLFYSKGFMLKEKFQIYGIAFIFFILLYNSPSGLVLYWITNNIFSLLKNILSKSKYAKKIIYIALCVFSVYIIIFFIPYGFSPKRLFIIALFSLIFFAPLIYKLFILIKNKFQTLITIENTSLSGDRTYILSCIILLLLCGLVIPGSLIASSVQEFSFLESYSTPFPFIFNVFIQSIGLFIFWAFCIYFLFSKKTKYILTFIISLLCVISLVNAFIFQGNFGFITTTFKFSAPDTFESNYKYIIISGIITFLIIILFSLLLVNKRKIIIFSFQLIILTALSLLSIFNFIKISKDFTAFDNLRKTISIDSHFTDKIEPVINFSKNGKNVLLLMIDSAISGYIPYIFDEKPELKNDFTGFTWYPNCIAFGQHTRVGAPLIFGGYEYEPKVIQKGRSYAMQKHNESLIMMPRIFSDNGYKTTVTDPVFANYSLTSDLSIFNPYPEINAVNIAGKYTSSWLRSHPDLKIISIPELLNELLLRFSFFKISPQAFRVFIYDKSRWLKPGNGLSKSSLSLETLDSFVTMDYLPLLTSVLNISSDTYTAIVTDLPHTPAMLQYPDYIPAVEITNNGSGQFADVPSYHVNISSILLTGKFLKYLKENDIYDNTRIIIVSDHGRTAGNYDGNISLPIGGRLSNYHALLLVKDFYDSGELLTDNTFMTHGDVPSIAMKGLIENQINPFSGKPIIQEKESGVTITTAGSLQYTISDDQWLHVKDNIFNIENWLKVK